MINRLCLGENKVERKINNDSVKYSKMTKVKSRKQDLGQNMGIEDSYIIFIVY